MVFGNEFDMLRPSAASPELHEERATVLIVDDDEQIRETLGALLGERFNVRLAASGPEGLAAMDDSVSVVILDVKMAGMDGFETCARLQENHDHVAVIFHTAYQDRHDLAEVINNYHPFGYLAKGSNASQVLRLVEGAVEFARVRQKNAKLRQELRELQAKLVRLGGRST